ncbi:MAG: glycosyltransferase family 1 protein [Gemmatimonadetes bacterium]|nr:glycosyltransferase family 1 protein [Gemmatimonadota bacterium]
MRQRVLLATVGTRGDVQPFLALAIALRDAGHDVAICTCPRFVPFIAPWGVATFPLDEGLLELLESPLGRLLIGKLDSVWSALRLLPSVIPRVRPIHERMVADTWAATVAWRPDVTVFHPKLFCVPAFASALGTRAIAAALAPITVPTGERPFWGMPRLPLGRPYNRATYQFLRGASSLGTRGYLREWRATHDPAGRSVGSAPHRMASGDPVPVLHAYSTAVVPRPADWPASAQVTGYWRMPSTSSDAGHGNDVLRAFLASGAPPVYIGFGSMSGVDPAATTALVVEAVRLAGVRAVFAAGWGGLQVASLPDTICGVDQVDHDWLFTRVAAVVHHGGAGTTAAGLHAGVPSVICPFGVDQPFWGRQVMELGAGPAPIAQRRLSAPALAAAISTCLSDPRYGAAARRIQEVLRREDGTDHAVRAIEASAAGS